MAVKKKKKMHFTKQAGAPSLEERPLADDIKEFIRLKVMLGDEGEAQKQVNLSRYRLENARKLPAFEDYENNFKDIWSRSIATHYGPLLKNMVIVGVEELAKRIKELKIPYVIHGHIHGGYGIEKEEKKTYVNCSVLDEEYRLANKPVVIDI